MATAAEKVNFEFLFTMAAATRATLRNLNKGFGSVNKQMDAVGKRANVLGSSIGGGVARGARSAAVGLKSMLVSGLAFAGISSVFSGLASTIPALGIALRTAGETIQRNLVAPIARALIPVLIKLTNFISENRTKFLALGAVILNVFRTLAGLAKNVVSLVSKLFTSFFDGIGLKAKLTFNNLITFFNFILLKVAFLFAFISALVEPVIIGIGKLFAAVFNNVIKPFLEGLAKGFGDSAGLMVTFRDAVMGVLNAFTSLIQTGGVKEFFGFLGRVIGTVLKDSLEKIVALVKVFTAIASALFKGIIAGLKSSLGSKGFGGMEKIFKKISKISKILFFKLLIPAFKKLVPAAKVLGFVIGKSLAFAFAVLGNTASGVIRIMEFFVVDLPNAFNASIAAVSRFWNTFKQGATGLFFAVVTPIQKIASTISAIFSALVLLMKDFIAKNVAPLIQSLSAIPGIGDSALFAGLQSLTTGLNTPVAAAGRRAEAQRLRQDPDLPTFIRNLLAPIAGETTSAAPTQPTNLVINTLNITAQDSVGIIQEIRTTLPARLDQIMAAKGSLA